MIVLTIQYRTKRGNWVNQTTVAVLDQSKLDAEIAALVAEFPSDIVARVKCNVDGLISYHW